MKQFKMTTGLQKSGQKSPKSITAKASRKLHTMGTKSKLSKPLKRKRAISQLTHSDPTLLQLLSASQTAPITLLSRRALSSSTGGGCASSTCCGGSCGSGSNDDDDDETVKAPPAGKKTVCDPYGLDGKPLPMDQVEMQIEFTLDNRWKYDTTTNQLSRTYSFNKQSLPPLVSHVPGALSGPCHGQGAAFTFLQAVNNISTNTNHWPYHIEVVPRKPQVIISLKTVGRAGITYADIGLATKFDAFFDANMTPKANKGTNSI